jgi:ERCC4-type nuclease
VLVSPTEPPRLKDLGIVSPLPEQNGCDFLIVSGKTMLGVQRKKFPEDLLASLADGRIYEQLKTIREKDIRALFIIEGYGSWTPDGELVGMRRFTYSQLIGLFASIMFEFAVPVLWVRDIRATIMTLESLESWAGKDEHYSLLRRPGPKSDSWGKVSREATASHLIQSFPGMGPGRARAWVRHFGGPMLQWTVTEGEMAKVPGIGKLTAKRLKEALDGQVSEEQPDVQGERSGEGSGEGEGPVDGAGVRRKGSRTRRSRKQG